MSVDRDALAREMRKVVPAPFTPRAIETAMRHIAAARVEALEEAAQLVDGRRSGGETDLRSIAWAIRALMEPPA
jgi:hypothetical protein